MTAEYLAAALGEDYLAAERALRVSTEAAAPPGVTMQQQHHTPGVETLGDTGEPPESELAVTGVVVQAGQQQEPLPAVTSAEPFYCCWMNQTCWMVIFLVLQSSPSL